MKIKPIKETFADLCLEAENGDEETDCCCDAQTQHHRLGIVETVKKKKQMSRLNPTQQEDVEQILTKEEHEKTQTGVPGQHSCHVGE